MEFREQIMQEWHITDPDLEFFFKKINLSNGWTMMIETGLGTPCYKTSLRRR